MKQTIAAYTAAGCNYPEYISISCNDSGNYEVTIREPANIEVKNNKETMVSEGRQVMIILSSQAFMELVDEINEKF